MDQVLELHVRMEGVRQEHVSPKLFGGSVHTLIQVLTSLEIQHLSQDLFCRSHHLGNKGDDEYFCDSLML